MHGFVSYRRFGKVRSLRSDRAWLVRGPMAILELVRGRFGFLSVAFGQSVFSGSIEIRTRFYRKVLYIDSVVADFDPNTSRRTLLAILRAIPLADTFSPSKTKLSKTSLNFTTCSSKSLKRAID
ncbi:hypothetical protein DY000_02006286 [Brassica cretica]|uniref:Uncharacterized protein n=1 Tax=Brassica cretica TaxID=69181 RepID=A0ABQ7BZS6_BRACR|nr:hypothetical protein DY000_02006286 [Brassica cretica]